MSNLRMPDLNQITIAGRLTRDAEVRSTEGGMSVASLSIANSRKYKGRDGNTKEDTAFVDVTVWGKPAEWCGSMKKGLPVIIMGRLTMSSWKGKDGTTHNRLQITADSVQSLEWTEDKAKASKSDDDEGLPF